MSTRSSICSLAAPFRPAVVHCAAAGLAGDEPVKSVY
jgi:hypothetical protein